MRHEVNFDMIAKHTDKELTVATDFVAGVPEMGAGMFDKLARRLANYVNNVK